MFAIIRIFKKLSIINIFFERFIICKCLLFFYYSLEMFLSLIRLKETVTLAGMSCRYIVSFIRLYLVSRTSRTSKRKEVFLLMCNSNNIWSNHSLTNVIRVQRILKDSPQELNWLKHFVLIHPNSWMCHNKFLWCQPW